MCLCVFAVSKNAALSFLKTWNRQDILIHPDTCSQILSSQRIIQPSKVKLNNFLLEVKHNQGEAGFDALTQIHNDIKDQGVLGMPRKQLQVNMEIWYISVT